MSRIAYVNGHYVALRAASVNVEDRGYQLADGVYEVIQVFRNRFIDADLHLDRLQRSLAEVRIAMPMTRLALIHVLQELARRNRVSEGLLYMQVTRGVARREHPFPRPEPKPAVVATIRRLPPYPKDVDLWATRAITRPDERWARCDIKSVALLPNVLARQAAREQGAYEAILVDAAGMVTEGAATTVWIVDREGVLRTRQLSHAILPGCTRTALIALLDGAPFAEGAFSEADLRQAQEAFLTSATSFVKPVTAIDGHQVGDGNVGPVTRKLFALFARHVGADLSNAP